MRTVLLAALLAAGFATTAAAQDDLPALTFEDLNGVHHQTSTEWEGRGGVLILGFAHDARDAMDQWVTALNLRPDENWLEAPAIGNVNGLIRPMIRGAMRARYDAPRRSHVTPVFEGADDVRALAAPGATNVVVLIVDAHARVVARLDGPANETNLRNAQSILAGLRKAPA